MHAYMLSESRDLKNCLDTAFDDGKVEGKIEMAREMKQAGFPFTTIQKYTGLSINDIENL